uniref:Synaptotagmin-1-like n=1 Tax=Saccoglossus kowalevskii TaxID=10224 RepID=A0ABM0M8N8_SACKO|nr:PREDICTED: synaptotagmin-1-like [Saccoglossus kowalevskii]
MIPDTSSEGIKKTSVVENTLNPTYNEIFTFHIQSEELADAKLRLQVWDKDIFSKDDFMGERIIDLGRFNFSEVVTNWFDLEAETDLSITGDLEVSLNYRLPQTLLVTVNRANDLVRRDPGRSADPYVKVSIPGIPEIHKTKIASGTLNPVWDETFEFDVSQEELGERYIVFHVIDRDIVSDTDSMGQICFDLDNFDIEEGFRGKFPLADMKNNNRVRTKWAQKALVQEFKEAMYAHAVYGNPGFLFQKQDGNKVLRVESKKAGTTTKLRTVDGVPL